MELISQADAIAPERLGQGDACRFWRNARLGGLEGLHARFVRHRYPRHTHDSYVMGVVTSGMEAFFCRGAIHRAAPGQVCFVNPGEVHDGEPVTPGYVYRMIYPDLALVRGLAEEIWGRGTGLPIFAQTVVSDPALARAFARLHVRLGRERQALGQDEGLLAVIGTALRRHAGQPGAGAPAAEPGGVGRARALIEACFADDLDLATLAREARLSRFHLVRAFRRAIGTTPHGYLLDRRVRAARERLRAGAAVADVAAGCGFADQAHLTRVFKARVGVTPGAFRRAAAA